MADDRTYRQGLIGSVIMTIIGAANLALGIEPRGLVGWGALGFGLVGLVVVLGSRRGWITPRQATWPTSSPTFSGGRVAPPAPPTSRPAPRLPEDGQRRVAEIVATLSAAGVFAPRTPDPRDLHESVADFFTNDEQAPEDRAEMVGAVLGALGEASYYHPGFTDRAYRANLVFHPSDVEQHDDYLRTQVEDLARLAGDALQVSSERVEQSFIADGAERNRTRITLRINGNEASLDYPGQPKYLSTMIHSVLARAVVEAGGQRLLAWLWTDQGAWITALPPGGVERLNADLGLDADSPSSWEWVHESEPMAAGEV
jgi:hypothetical protein